ncbi:Glycosyl transferase family 2 [Lachnospiraceae bacterium]|nr:Glycosyl transferase family 2 [Lachnospiraceae bacterium]
MKISVIIPVYNVKTGYLEKCIESLEDQKGMDRSEYEVIAVDDGSRAETAEALDRLEKDNTCLKVIHQENGGTSVARNTGLDAAAGEYVLFVDGDDWISDDCLSTILSDMERDPVDILFFGYATSYTNREMNRVLQEPPTGIWNRETLELAVLEGNPALGPVEVGAPWGKLVKRQAIEEGHVRYTPGLRKGQDTVFVLHLLEHCSKFRYLPYLGYHYRISGSSVSKRFNPEIVEIMEKTLTEYRKFTEKYGKDKRFVDAVNRKYYKVLTGEYQELYFTHRENHEPEKKRIQGFYKLIMRSPYKEAVRDVSSDGLSAFNRLQLHLIRKKKIGFLFLVRKMENILRNTVVRKYD